MRIDYTAASMFRRCPLKYYERYVQKVEPQRDDNSRLYGKRIHELLHEHRAHLKGVEIIPYGPLENEALEAECQAAYALYLAHYPVEPFDIIEAEQVRVVPLLDSRHELVVKLDSLVRMRDTGEIKVLDTKTQKRNSNNNDPEHWAARPQVSLYVYAARLLYPKEKISDEIILDLIRRQSPGGQITAEFHRDAPRRSNAQIADDISALIYTADEVEHCAKTGYWPAYKDNCKIANWKCDYYPLHVNVIEAREDLLRKHFRPAEDYLGLEGE